MKKALFKILASTMALLVFFSTLSFTVDMHFCGDKLVETAFFHKAKGCGMTMEKPATNDCSTVKKNCCSEKQSLVNGQDELQLNLQKISFEKQIFVAAFVQTYYNLFQTSEKEVSSYTAYSPPFVVKNIYKLDETYLI
ncbi:HYC_CC_PP family protein [Gaetbulibacter aestuarii]|uniref:Secreted protein n=1 Tax=Gaetbulibacter aestuarii TaxID=1502358 RepID=A0ABW7N2G7_9FLAO